MVTGRLREWSFARATAERSTAEVIAEGMAPRSGADHARDGDFGWAQAWSESTNADRGGNLARRRIGSSKRVCPCVYSLRQKSEIPVSAPRIRSRTYRLRGRGQGLAEWEHLPRTFGLSVSLRRRKETNGDQRRRTSESADVRNGAYLRASEAGLLRREWRSNRVRRKASRVMVIGFASRRDG
jgi:hypothetical protein